MWNITPKNVGFLDLREDRQPVPAPRTRDIADCATESPAKPAELVLRMFQLHVQRPREENAMFRSSCLNLSGPAGIAPCLGFKYARPPNPA